MARYGSVDHKITNPVEICFEKQKYKNDFRHSLIFTLLRPKSRTCCAFVHLGKTGGWKGSS